jgi:hypothetical protein
VSEIISTLPPPKTAAEYRAAIELLLYEAQRLSSLMEADRVEIDRLSAETRAIEAHVDAGIERLEAIVASLGRG